MLPEQKASGIPGPQGQNAPRGSTRPQGHEEDLRRRRGLSSPPGHLAAIVGRVGHCYFFHDALLDHGRQITRGHLQLAVFVWQQRRLLRSGPAEGGVAGRRTRPHPGDARGAGHGKRPLSALLQRQAAPARAGWSCPRRATPTPPRGNSRRCAASSLTRRALRTATARRLPYPQAGATADLHDRYCRVNDGGMLGSSPHASPCNGTRGCASAGCAHSVA